MTGQHAERGRQDPVWHVRPAAGWHGVRGLQPRPGADPSADRAGVSGLAKVPVERLSVMILPWLAVSLVVLFLVTYLPSDVVLVFANWLG